MTSNDSLIDYPAFMTAYEWQKGQTFSDAKEAYNEFLEMYLNQAKKRESGWVFIEFCKDGKLHNYPKHEQEVLFVYGESVYAGCFLDDIRKSHYPDGEKYEGEFGFYTMDDKFYETEHVRCWMPSLMPPKRTEIEAESSNTIPGGGKS